jgi:8-oxo-dGTP pyrophosphatase MutT (NUDIX family)
MKKPIKHYTASVLIFTDSAPAKVLLVHHKKFDKWMQPGGHQEEHENPVEAAIRETKEETGLDISPYLTVGVAVDEIAAFLPRPQYLLEELIAKHGREPEHYHLDQFYIVRMPEQEGKHRPKESKDIRWFRLDELGYLPMFKNLRTLIEQEMTQ